MIDLDDLPYRAAYYQKPRAGTVRLIVIHTAETGEGSSAAEGIAAFFSSKAALDASGSVGSAHICVDDNSIIRCAPDDNRTNGAAGANDDGLHLEIAGRASQTTADWSDAYSTAALENAAQTVAAWCHRHAIPARYLGADEVKAGAWGITGHVCVSAAYGQSGHYDPGPNFPWPAFVARVNEILSPMVEESDVTPEECEKIIDEKIAELKTWFLKRGGEYREMQADTAERGCRRVVDEKKP